MHVCVLGVVAATHNPGEGVVLMHSHEIKRLPPNLQCVHTLLRLVSQGQLNTTQIALATNVMTSELSA